MSITATNARSRQSALPGYGVASQAMREHVQGLIADLDAAHRDGLSIPPKAAEAVAVLGALAEAWTANAMGRPASASAKDKLGLLPRAIDE